MPGVYICRGYVRTNYGGCAMRAGWLVVGREAGNQTQANLNSLRSDAKVILSIAKSMHPQRRIACFGNAVFSAMRFCTLHTICIQAHSVEPADRSTLAFVPSMCFAPVMQCMLSSSKSNAPPLPPPSPPAHPGATYRRVQRSRPGCWLVIDLPGVPNKTLLLHQEGNSVSEKLVCRCEGCWRYRTGPAQGSHPVHG